MKKDREYKFGAEEIAEDLSKKLKGKALQAWELYLLREEGLSVEAKDQKLDSMESENTLSLALRVIDHGKLGFGYSSDFRPEQVKRLIDEVLSRAKQADFDPDLNLPDGGQKSRPMPEIFDSAFHTESESEKIKRAMRMEKSALDFDGRIKRVRGCEYQEGLREIIILNSFGLRRQASSTHFTAMINAVAEQGKEAQIASEFDWSFRYDMLDADKVGESVARKAVAKLGAKPVSSRKTPVVFCADVAGEFLELLSFAVNGESLAKNKTWLKDMQGKKIFSDCITVIDDGLFAKGPECFPFDGEGAGSQKKFVVRNGVLREFIYDSYYASKMKSASTANARRDQIGLPPSIGPSNFYITPGNKSFKQLVAAIDSGMVVEEALGMHMADEITGEYSIGVSGRLIEKGKLDRPVRGVAMAGNLKELFARVGDKGSDLKFYLNCASPSLLIEEMEISGS